MRVGFFCRYVPFELILACGGEPLQIRLEELALRGNSAYFPVPFCATAKFFIDWMNRGGLEKVDVLVFPGSCDAARRLYEVVQHLFADSLPLFLLEVPHHLNEMTIARFAHNLRSLALNLGRLSGVSLPALEKQLPGLIFSSLVWRRKWGELFFKGFIWGDVLRKVDFLEMPSANKSLGKGAGIPVLLSGGHIFMQEITLLLEETGFKVLEDSPYAMRRVLGEGFDGLEAVAEEDPFLALSKLYLQSLLPCPRMNDLQRISMLKKAVTSLGILGVVYFYSKFCDFSLYELPLLKKELSPPFLAIDCDTSQEEISRWRIRIEAFHESLCDHVQKRPAS